MAQSGMKANLTKPNRRNLKKQTPKQSKMNCLALVRVTSTIAIKTVQLQHIKHLTLVLCSTNQRFSTRTWTSSW